MTTIIEVKELKHRFGTVQALDGLTFSVQEGEVFGFLGPNGAGKTTTVRLLNGILSPTSGEMHVLGRDPRRQGSDLRRHTGVLTETPSLYERLTARDNLMTFGRLYAVPEDQLAGRVQAVLEQFGLLERADDRTGGFSKGMKQRLALARTLLHEPDLLFLDEPTSGLDPEAALQVTQMIERISHQKGRSVFLCTHNLAEAQRLCDRVAVLTRGRLLAVGTQEDLAETLWHGTWVDMHLEQQLTAADLAGLSAAQGVRAVETHQNLLSIQVDRPGRVPDLICSLVQRGARILQVTPREHSLEDIYFEIQKQPKEA